MLQPAHYDAPGNTRRVALLRERGVEIWGPERVYVHADVPLKNIEPGAVIYQATLCGKLLRVGRGARIGVSGHARLNNCQIGRWVELGAGSYEGATILDNAKVRGFAEIRTGTLLEEDVEAAHNVAFKNTVMTATVVAGSLINYCDIFMSGGTSRSDHSEVGSGVVHFNFDPRGDKYGSLIGDVRGVLLRSAPVFVGGQCGLVAPLHVDFGAVLAAGSVVRRDVPAGRVHFETAPNQQIDDFDREIYTALRRKFLTTAKLIGNLGALATWYEQVRLPFCEDYQKPLYEAARGRLQSHIQERVQRLERIIGRLERSIEKSSHAGDQRLMACHAEHRRLLECHQKIVDRLTAEPEGSPPPARFLQEYEKARGAVSHQEALGKIEESTAAEAADWLYEIAEEPARQLAALLG